MKGRPAHRHPASYTHARPSETTLRGALLGSCMLPSVEMDDGKADTETDGGGDDSEEKGNCKYHHHHHHHHRNVPRVRSGVSGLVFNATATTNL